MNAIQLLTILSTLILATFLLYSYTEYGMTRSISAIYYKLEKEKKWYYTAAMIGLALPLLLAGVFYALQTLTTESVWAVVFLTASSVFIIFTGLAPDIRDNSDIEKIHVIGATGGMILSGIALLFLPTWYFVLPQFFLSLLFHFGKVKNRTYFIEVINFVCVAGALALI